MAQGSGAASAEYFACIVGLQLAAAEEAACSGGSCPQLPELAGHLESEKGETDIMQLHDIVCTSHRMFSTQTSNTMADKLL